MSRVEGNHDVERCGESQHVADEGRVKVRFGKGSVDIGRVGGLLGLVSIKPQQERQEKARNDNVSQPQQGHVGLASFLVDTTREQYLDGTIQILGHCDHDVRTKAAERQRIRENTHVVNTTQKTNDLLFYSHPENVVKKESDQENGTDFVGPEGESFDSLQAEAYAQNVVHSPVFVAEIYPTKDG